MKIKAQLEVISYNATIEKLSATMIDEIEIDKKYDFKAYDPIPNIDYDRFEITIYLLFNKRNTGEELFHFIGNLKLILTPTTNQNRSDDMSDLHSKLEPIYEDIWLKLSTAYGIKHDLLIKPYFDPNVIAKIFEYLDKWSYYS